MIFSAPPKGFVSQVEIVTCFVEYKERILLLHRLPHKPQGNMWGAPGGKVEVGEKLIDAVRRELLEETGLSIEPEKLECLKPLFIKYPDLKFNFHVYKTKLSQEPQIILETMAHSEYIWVTPQDGLKLNLMPDVDQLLNWLYFNQKIGE